ncbi:ABC transporter permease [Caldilinea sp.]|uniref:ABC transporter permease n=1 Tax=Caldilinea sp. TaxID=2293560 RepID=UPI002CE97C7D|nr:ABC transporter permease [Anaerolineales bacterium]HQY91593.1 ABC transporter permease [Caldilinea sp.]HRA65664.1 ABC transporter permease [Caldilinea sp.]
MTATTASPTLTGKVVQRKHRTLWGDAWIQFRRNRLAVFGLIVLVALILAVVAGPYIYRVDPKYIDIMASGEAPSSAHPFGTDDLGRDLFARNLYGGRISLAVGFAAMLIAMTFGTTVGLLSGFVPRLDNLLMRFTDMMFALPQLPLLLVISSLLQDTLRRSLGQELGAFLLVVTVIGMFGWMPTSRIVRGSVLSIKRKEYVEAAVNVGARDNSIMMRHILPNVFGSIIVAATLEVAAAILTESTLSFLGLGFPSDVPTWGRLLYEGKDFLTTMPWISFFPGLLISLTILAINFMGDGLRDALDPRQRQ